MAIERDPSSQSNFYDVETKNVAFDWEVDFDTKTIKGTATYSLEVKKDGVTEVIFDTIDLKVFEVKVDGKASSYEFGAKHPIMGSALHIPLPKGLKGSDTSEVWIKYETSPQATALQWLSKEQTKGKQFPFLFSQCQPNYARSLAPLQDSPSDKIIYDAKVTSILPALMSAVRVSPPADGPAHDGKVIGKDAVTYVYRQSIPIPSYLLAIAVGNVVYRPFAQFEDKKWKTGVWAEPETIEQAYWEFSEDTARFLAEEEKVVTTYRFGVYDLLVLPPAFPYGGMENACLTFLTPTLLTGDRALVDVVVHELTHSWFGNGITHANASHFWLNEGWTTYMERLLQQFLHTPAHRDFSFIIGAKALKDSLADYSNTPKYQRLVIDFEVGEDTDEAYSSIPYEKGANLILHLERTLGGINVFLPYVKEYVETFIGKSITTTQWKDHLYEYFAKHGGEEKTKALDSIDWDAWLYGEGLELPVEMTYDDTLAKEAHALAANWHAAAKATPAQYPFKESDIDGFDTNQLIAFLEKLQTYPTLPSPLVQLLGDIYHFDTTENAEVRFRYYEIALRDPKAEPSAGIADKASKWVTGSDGSGNVKGRMKFCRPTFRAIAAVDKQLASTTFAAHKSEFHPIAAKMIEKDIEKA
ncbi:leukotriene-A4 hydrolase [Coprinopsis marcescibilis]|uniref:Leukotriene-A4 hydrolase n=1 Tax=Coprinopsis marcescibilis TaxID=230819 RepID=A0A5C3LC49_COPMA|nr:leukotriene-A4 hydrolase [Coprinopsis marcescibilis]